jgi:hypothetical protein
VRLAAPKDAAAGALFERDAVVVEHLF